MTMEIQRRALLLAGLPAWLSACGGGGTPVPDRGEGVATQVLAVTGMGQQGVAGETLAEALTVQALDANGRPVAGLAVAFVVVAGAGQLFAGQAVTDASGRASERWTLGGPAGTQAVEVRSVLADGTAQVWLRFEATAEAAAPAALEVVDNGGNAAQLQPLPAPTRVRVRDRFGNPCPGVTVNFDSPDGGHLSPATAVTAADGTAVTQWTLGPVLGTQTATARTGTAATTLYATAMAAPPGRPAQIVKRLGDQQRTPAHTETGVQAQVLDGLGNPVPGASVRFAVETLPDYFPPELVQADGNGLASWTRHVHSAGTQVVAATIPGDTSVAAARFTLEVTPQGERFDGVYDFVAEVLSSSGDATTVRFDRLLTDSRWPEYDLPLDPATGDAPRILIRLGPSGYYELRGQFTMDAAGRVTGEGTLGWFGSGPPDTVTGTWTAVRR